MNKLLHPLNILFYLILKCLLLRPHKYQTQLLIILVLIEDIYSFAQHVLLGTSLSARTEDNITRKGFLKNVSAITKPV